MREPAVSRIVIFYTLSIDNFVGWYKDLRVTRHGKLVSNMLSRLTEAPGKS
jgi:hypothetical protein